MFKQNNLGGRCQHANSMHCSHSGPCNKVAKWLQLTFQISFVTSADWQTITDNFMRKIAIQNYWFDCGLEVKTILVQTFGQSCGILVIFLRTSGTFIAVQCRPGPICDRSNLDPTLDWKGCRTKCQHRKIRNTNVKIVWLSWLYLKHFLSHKIRSFPPLSMILINSWPV